MDGRMDRWIDRQTDGWIRKCMLLILRDLKLCLYCYDSEKTYMDFIFFPCKTQTINDGDNDGDDGDDDGGGSYCNIYVVKWSYLVCGAVSD